MANIPWAIAPEGHDEGCEMFGKPLNYRGRRSIDCRCRERSDAATVLEGHDEGCEMLGTPLSQRSPRSVDCRYRERSDAYVEWLDSRAPSRNAPPEAPAPGASGP
jgi:hypothetical protein